jgi:NADH:ubiquinone oxidoreductase subunit 4 (subunit M)
MPLHCAALPRQAFLPMHALLLAAYATASPALFLHVGLHYERTHTTLLVYTRGVAAAMPLHCAALLAANLANLSFPGGPNFPAEMLGLLCLFAAHELCAYVFGGCQVLAAAYAFWVFNRLAHGLPCHTQVTVLDFSRREWLLLLPLACGVLWLGTAAFWSVGSLQIKPPPRGLARHICSRPRPESWFYLCSMPKSRCR